MEVSDPPFSLVASTLWFPATILLLSFELFDYIRVYDHYLDDDVRYPVSKCLYWLYSKWTVFECIGVVCFAQIFASSPNEHIYVHTYSFIIFVSALWRMVLKRFLYLRSVGAQPQFGVLHVLLCCVSTVIMMCLYLPNLHGAKLWESYPWTKTVQKVNDVFFAVLMLAVPMAIYGFIPQDFLDTVVVTVDRSNGDDEKSYEEKDDAFL